jgi:hypothetical protein
MAHSGPSVMSAFRSLLGAKRTLTQAAVNGPNQARARLAAAGPSEPRHLSILGRSPSHRSATGNTNCRTDCIHHSAERLGDKSAGVKLSATRTAGHNGRTDNR